MSDLQSLKSNFEKEKLSELGSFLESKQHISFETTGQTLVSVILVLYNRAELTLACLQSLKENCNIPIELIVVDNNSSDDTSLLFSRVKGVNYIKNEENVNFLKACNQASDHAHGKYLLFLNNDAAIRSRAIENAIKVFQEEHQVGAVGGKIILVDGKLQEAGSIVWNDGSCLGYGRGSDPDSFEYMFRREVNFCSGAFLLTSSSLFNEMGKFDEAYAPAYYEETDFCLNLQENGYKVYYEPTCVIDHFEFASSDKQSSAIKLQRKNQETFFNKHKEYLGKLKSPKTENIILSRQINKSKKILFVEDRIPHEDLGAGFPRSNQIINSLISLGYQVSVYSLNFLQEDDWDSIYRDINRKCELITNYARANIDKFIEDRKDYFDLIWISRPHNMEFLHDKISEFNNVKVIYDAEAIFSDREIEKVKITGDDIDPQEILKEELSLGDFADHVVAVKEKDAELFQKHGHQGVSILNVAFSPPEYLSPFGHRKDILFVGNMDYDDSPNVDSLEWYIDEVLPLIKNEIPDVKLHLVGTNKSKTIQKYGKQNEDIILHGRVDDLNEMYNSCKLFIAPTRYAAGSPAKVFMAAAYGIPIVATDLIISQVGWKKGDCIEGCDFNDPQKFAEICTDVYSNEVVWKKLSSNSSKKIIEKNSVGTYLQQLNEIVNKTLGIEQTKRKKVTRLKIETIENEEVKLIFENFNMLKRENLALKHQIKEGEIYVLKLLEEINNKNTEISLRGEVITYHEKGIFFKIKKAIKKSYTSIGEKFQPLRYHSKTAFRLIGIFLKNPLKSFSLLKKDNVKAFLDAANNEPMSIVLDNIAKKINKSKDE